jgi:hypothetical protein
MQPGSREITQKLHVLHHLCSIWRDLCLNDLWAGVGNYSTLIQVACRPTECKMCSPFNFDNYYDLLPDNYDDQFLISECRVALSYTTQFDQ